MSLSVPELHLFLIWSQGREREGGILADLRREFEVLDVVEVSWTMSEFGRNLTRFYGEALPSGSEKEEHCGTGPFLVIVVRDREPQLELRHLGRGARVIDARVLAAKERYRAWTGGGHRVHATLNPHEFAHDLFLLFGRLRSHYDEARSWNGDVGSRHDDLVGARGWTNVEELLTALESTLGRVALVEPVDESSGRVVIAVDDPWWAAVVANGRPGLEDPVRREHTVEIAGRAVQLEIRPVFAATEPPSRVGEWMRWLRGLAIDVVARSRSRKAGLALVFHRVGDPPGDRRFDVVPSLGLSEFETQLRRLRRRYRIVRASELLEATRARRRFGRFPVSLTFDDDLPSHVRIAAPVLRGLGLPAAFFVAGPAPGKPEHFWWDDLQRAVDRQTLTTDDLPSLDRAEVDAALHREPSAVRRLAGSIVRAQPSLRREIAAQLRAQETNHLERALGAEELRALAEQGFEIGFHTLEHPVLPSLEDAELQQALTDGRDALAAKTGRNVRVIAYPHGRADDRVAAAARSVGFDVGYAGFSRAATDEDDPLLLPRWEPPFTAGRSFDVAVARILRD